MAFSSTTEWEVRTTGLSTNGGGFDTSSTGTDFSQQNSPQITYTDMVIDAATNTKFTSAGNPVTSAHVGNIINVTSGTGFTVQRVQIVSQAAGVATCDKSLGTLASTGGNGKLGGGFLALSDVTTLPVAGNKIHIKAGTYSKTTTDTFSLVGSTAVGEIQFIGYNTTHNDGGTKPVLTSATNSIAIITLTAAAYLHFKNLKITSTAGTRGNGFDGATSNSTATKIEDCIIDGCAIGYNGASRPSNPLVLINSQFLNCTSDAVNNGSTDDCYDACFFYNNTGVGFNTGGNSGTQIFTDCVFAKNATGYSDTGTTRTIGASFINCTFVDNTSDGIKIAENTGTFQLEVANCIFYNNTGYGINHTVFSAASANAQCMINRNNAYGSNSSGSRSVLSAGSSDVALSADPFNNRTGQDYSLNNTVGGGASCRATGLPGVFQGGLTTSYPDIGAAQHLDAPPVISLQTNMIGYPARGVGY